MMLVTGGLTLLISLIIKVLIVIGKSEWSEYTAVPYFIVHCLGTVCTYKGWVPESFKAYPKDVMQW